MQFLCENLCNQEITVLQPIFGFFAGVENF